MKYLNLCALLLCGAFFSNYTFADPATDQAKCTDIGGTFVNDPELGEICSMPAPNGTVYEATYSQYSAKATGSTKQEALDALGAVIATSQTRSTTSTNYGTTLISNTNLSFNSANPANSTLYFTVSNTYTLTCPPEQEFCTPPASATFDTDLVASVSEKIASYCPPDNSPKLRNVGGAEPSFFCWAPALAQPPCDCSELAGEGYIVGSDFVAKKDVYSSANPPQCSTVTDPTTGQQCNCQLIAQKWMQFGSGSDVSWSPLPYEQGKPSGTYTGATCGEEDADTQPPEKEECFTLKTGQKWCFANPAEKCTTVNGQQQCETGCGFINGDFVCYEQKDPIIPDRPDTPKKDVDDDITDPNKLMPDMTKGDLKEIQKGSEQRLDNINISIDNNNNELKNLGDKIGQTNSKLDGIGQQLDGQGKTLKGIKDGLDDAFGDDGAPDGKCEGECTGSWYESVYPDGMVGIWQEHSAALQQTPAFDFLNQFQLSPDGSQPDFNFCFNLGAAGDFGCHSLELPAILWPFIRICILISAAFLCRALIFGG